MESLAMPSSLNWSNQTIWTGDNLPIMRGMNSASVDLIYLDPPFNSKANYAAPIGSKAAGAEFKDTWTLRDVDAEWINLIEAKHPALYRVILAAMTDSDKSYLAYMAARLLEMRRILKPTGSIYLHCDPTMSHYLKLVMDAVFGRRNFRNEIVWHYGGRMMHKVSQFNRKHDIILFYTPSGEYTFDLPKDPVDFEQYAAARHEKIHQTPEGRRYLLAPDANRERTIRQYEDDLVKKGRAIDDVWPIRYIRGNAKERTGYPTQKPLALLRRIIAASSNEGDMVLDPFCGCATALIAAEELQREWVGIDISRKAAELVTQRMKDELGLFFRGSHRTDIPQRTDLLSERQVRKARAKHKEALYGEQGGLCLGCGEHFRPQNLEVDHIIPRSKGGADHIDNLQLLCGHCNRVKGDRGMEYLRVKLQL